METLDNLRKYSKEISDKELRLEIEATEFQTANANNGLGIWLSTAVEDAKKGFVFGVENNLNRLNGIVEELYSNKHPYKMIFRGILDIAYTNGIVREKDSKNFNPKKVREYQIKRALIQVPDFEEDLDFITKSGYENIVNYANNKIRELESKTFRGKVRSTKKQISGYLTKGK